MTSPQLDLLTAQAQIMLARRTLFLFGTMLLLLLILLIVPGIKASPEIVSLVSAATGSLGTILAQQNGFFFARHRAPSSTDADGDDPNPIQPVIPASTETSK